MAIDYDTSALPKGTIGWTSLLTAVEDAHLNDENQWIEFKANLDPTTVNGRFAVAKAIVAFANRDPKVAAKWLAGHAIIVVGLEPGNLTGSREVDPADLYNNINQLLAAPAPAWDPTPVTYKGEHVLIITVDPPHQGDPIACIGKNSGDAIDGHIYVRKQGKSERATSADIRRLSARLSNAGKTISGISIEHGTGTIPVIDYPDTWLDDWLRAEERRLLAPLDPPPASRPVTDAELKALGISRKIIADYAAQADKAAAAMAATLGTVTHEESRSEEEYRAEVTVYLEDCRRHLVEAFEDLRSTAATEITLSITNQTNQNYEQTFVELHFDGDVYGYEYDAEFANLADYLPDAPRPWGPWTENRLLAGMRMPDLGSLYSAPSSSFDTLRAGDPWPSPTIRNDGSVTVTCVPVHLYPVSTTDLITLRLIAKAPYAEPVSVTWTATAANVDGKIKGSFTIPVAGATVDIADVLKHRDA
ncbi:ATP-binding protein [Nocardioides sp. NPDC092400]|uniref:AlbA family DNA-binding domain-containing protein n=1 Tax=Nocardioides sp. NPDC092400 TaxID=3155196 RepID=UPI003418BD9F